ncbi:branched-chain amino acid ABC transporter permease [Tritonibacter horizontis]|uniref:High-affinity branched-chain amino acid transport system permease protein LivH n=1 Tax=Tritonibacter horizontis TaxID=1768241 RepID=A0A132BUQ5_9RHOB|nr:branched-chain amino acid ABC transporter permease [Tritonibacter horizontis]KUP92128.1 high-affinity branched-chain amino acid transport system permease protein LivH [Tritonibacter horizontis]
MLEHVVNGLVLGGTYALVAMGLTIQYGIARIMNLSFGDTIIAACFATYVLFSAFSISPLLALLILVPAGYGFSLVIYKVIMKPLVARAPDEGALEVDSILVTFGLLFVLQGVLLTLFGGGYNSYSFLNTPVNLLGTVVAGNRLLALVLSLLIGAVLVLTLYRTRWGMVLRAVALAPQSAPLFGIDTDRAARTAFAIGGAMAATGGVVVSMFQTFTATAGVVFTMKALIVVILGGKGSVPGAIVAGLLLGLVETFVAAYIDPGLTLAAVYTVFLLLLLVRPNGIFGKA